MKVLYVENSQAAADLVRLELGRCDPVPTVEIAPTLAEARRRLGREGPFDVVLADLRLPDGNALELLREIRQQALSVAVVIVGAEETAVEALKAGADDYVAKRGGDLARLPTALENAHQRVLLARENAALRVRETRLQSIIATAPECIAIHAPDGRLLEMNAAGLAMLEAATLAEVQDRPLMDFVSPEHRAPFAELHRRVMSGGTGVLDFAVKGLKGTRRWLEIRAVPLRGDAGEIQALLGMTQDVTEHRQTEERLRASEEALRHSEEKFSKAFQSSPDSLVMSRLDDGRIVEVNEVFVRLTGYSREEAMGRTTLDLGLWGDPGDRERYLTALRGGGGVRDQAAQFRRKVGTLIDGLVSGEIIRLGEELVALTTIRDVTDRKRAEEERSTLEAQLRHSQKMEAIGRLAGGVAHDFNNMLGVILGYADIALRKLSPIDPLRRNMAGIRDAAQRSADLTQRLLAFSRQQVIAPRVIDLNARLMGMERLLQRVIGEDVALEFVLAPDAWPVSMDPSQVDQVLANLAVNARDAMPDGGKLIVETANVSLDAAYCRQHAGARPGENVMLAVSDTGTGMDERTRERAFEPFFTTKAEGKGTGFGLATVYGVVKQNDGFIDIHSEPGHGTTVKLYIPRAQADEMAQPAAASNPAPSRGHETVLLVEDQNQLREIAREMLEDLGYTVLVAASPGDALTLCEEHTGEIHLLFTDVVMPNMNGKELAGRVQTLKPGIRTLFTSGYTADTIAHRGVLAAGIWFLEKPFSMDSLARKVREVLSSP